ncbi:hypothetical protein GCM10025864_24020 [Luteimicrobium album]|uniref:Enoyl reductase (ER) domain-containing protein n=1 Tax=Luteimicrobium album TaxID=1054550 RepID=A0ABQ6I1K8_9MICO|nr:zinc-binding dehydrogenase [Luteimicrobium album]GMA24643.1 hypothetical protein GCM10025864_24020 [Luteimicrobium album]
MRAIGFDTVGGPEVLVEAQLPRPRPGAGDVLVEVAFAGVNFAEVQHRRGEFGDPDGFDVPGLEVAGTVVQVGSRVASVRPGDVVAAYLPGFGGYAELAVTSEAFVARVPAGLAPEVAAGVPCVYPTAYGVLADAGRLAPGETVLIHAATGGVGSAAAGVARSLGASAVYGTVGSAAKLDLADRLGYDRLFERDGFAEQVLQATGGRGVDVVLERGETTGKMVLRVA